MMEASVAETGLAEAESSGSVAPPVLASIIFRRDSASQRDAASELLQDDDEPHASPKPVATDSGAEAAKDGGEDAHEGTGTASAGDDAEEVANVGTLIEELNGAIDHVNDLEDEHQACCARHAATARELRTSMGVLEAESARTRWQTAAVAAAEACEAAGLARQQLAAAEHAAAQQSVEQSWAQAELAAADGHEAKQALTQRLAQVRTSIAAAAKVVASARKAATTATAREDKARRNLQRAHAQESRPWMLPPGALPPLPVEDELAIVSKWLAVRGELRRAAQTEAVDLAEFSRRKEEAAARVSAAMLALEAKSEEIHERQQAAEEAAADGGEEDEGDDDDDDGSGDGGGGGGSGREGSLRVGGGRQKSASSRSSAEGEDGGDSDFVLDSSESEDEGGGGGAEAGAEGSADTPRRAARKRSRRGETSTVLPPKRGSIAGEAENGMLATRTAVTRLLRRASELVNSSPILQPSVPPPRESVASAVLVDYVIDPWHGLVWVDAASVARSQTEESQTEAQYL